MEILYEEKTCDIISHEQKEKHIFCDYTRDRECH